MTVYVYDTGALIALERQDGPMWALHERLVARRGLHPPVVLVPVLAQAWRPQPGHWSPMSRALRACTVFSADPHPPACGVCAAGHTTDDGKRAGALAATASLPRKKSADAVDALVTVVAAGHEQAVVVTSDPDDLCAYRDALGPVGRGVLVLPVDGIAKSDLL